MEWKNTREMWGLMREMRRELAPQKEERLPQTKVEKALASLCAFPRAAIGTVVVCGGAAIVDAASTARKKLRGGQ